MRQISREGQVATFGARAPEDVEVAARPRVLVVGPLYPQGGGVGTVDHTLLNCDLGQAYDMRLLNTGRGKIGEGKQGRLAAINFYYYVRDLLRLLGILIFRRPDILHQSLTNGPGFFKESSFMVLAGWFGVKAIGHLHGNPLEAEYRAGGPLLKALIQRSLSAADLLVVLNEHWRAFLVETVKPAAPVVVVPNGVDQTIAEAMERPADARVKDDCMVLFLGWLGARKGVPDALQAVPLVRHWAPGVRFVFAGALDGEERDKASFEQACRAAERAGGVSFPGLVAGEQKVALLSQASILILPSYTENLPMSVLEAMAMGLPVVATPVGGVPETVTEGRNGFLVAPGDYEALAERIIRLVEDPGLRQVMGQANMAKVRQEYHPKVFAARIQSLYRQLMER